MMHSYNILDQSLQIREMIGQPDFATKWRLNEA
jgi:hypothetical protein